MAAATEYKDFYAILGVSKDASQAEIKKAFRQLARKYHPDVNPGDQEAEQRFKEINEAHEVLSDPEKRAKYDQFGQYWQQGGMPGNAGVDVGQYGSFEDFLNELLGHFGNQQAYSYQTNPTGFGGFEDIFGGGFGATQPPVADIEAQIQLTFAEAFEGVQKQFSLNGETIKVRIPPGAKSGSRVRVRGKGQLNPMTNQRGDLYLNVELQPHHFFQFDGDNLVGEVPLTPPEAALGSDIQVPTPEGSVTVKVPSGVNSGQTLRLRGKGWQKPRGQRTDLLIKLKVVTPDSLTETEREYYQKLQEVSSTNPRQSLESVRL
ncbi:MAG: DnaJ C-terminal domain-containing protein [Spirulinaceae cyanobacterium]